jgi:hypothetical protein
MIVDGLRSGEADLNGDGVIDASELYGYVFDRVREVAPEQTPTRNDQLAGEVYIAQPDRPRPRDAEDDQAGPAQRGPTGPA